MSDPKERLSSADIKKQIEEATKAEKAKTEIKDSGLPITGQLANEINASESTPEAKPKAESKTEPGTPASEDKGTASSVDLKEWGKKKGYDATTDDAVLAVLYKADQAFHAKRQADKTKERSNPPTYQPPVYQPPEFVPQPNSNPRAILEELARQENMLPEDFERVARVSRRVYEAATQADRERQRKEMDGIRIENQKNAVFRELSIDPVFRRPDVAVEYQKVLVEMQEKNPEAFEQDPNEYRRAFDRTLQTIARRNLEGQPLQEGVPPRSLPVNPPKPFGQTSGGGSLENENDNAIDPKQFAKLSVNDKRKVLESRGLVSGY